MTTPSEFSESRHATSDKKWDEGLGTRVYWLTAVKFNKWTLSTARMWIKGLFVQSRKVQSRIAKSFVSVCAPTITTAACARPI